METEKSNKKNQAIADLIFLFSPMRKMPSHTQLLSSLSFLFISFGIFPSPKKKKKYNKKEKRIHPHQHEPFNRVWEREKKDKETTAAPTRRVHTFFASAKRKPT